MEGYTVTLNGGASNTRVYGGGYGTVQSIQNIILKT